MMFLRLDGLYHSDRNGKWVDQLKIAHLLVYTLARDTSSFKGI